MKHEGWSSCIDVVSVPAGGRHALHARARDLVSLRNLAVQFDVVTGRAEQRRCTAYVAFDGQGPGVQGR